MEIHWKSIGKPVEISMKYKWKSELSQYRPNITISAKKHNFSQISHQLTHYDADNQCHGCRHTIRWGALGDWSMSRVQNSQCPGCT